MVIPLGVRSFADAGTSMECEAFAFFSQLDWVNWVAQDRDGHWWAYSVEPLRHDAG
jgi:hypothetical protein